MAFYHKLLSTKRYPESYVPSMFTLTRGTLDRWYQVFGAANSEYAGEIGRKIKVVEPLVTLREMLTTASDEFLCVGEKSDELMSQTGYSCGDIMRAHARTLEAMKTSANRK